MSLILSHPEKTVSEITQFLQQVLSDQGKRKVVVAVSGGIDSAVSLTLATTALGPENVFPILLPHDLQPMETAKTIVEFNHIPEANVTTIDISPAVKQLGQDLGVNDSEAVRLGNIKARVRMIAVFDLAKKWDALVCGTENKSEHHLGYFTRFGDAASDIEPIAHLYKTQVRQLGEHLNLPAVFLTQAPSAGLWLGQTDESELGFSYREADLVLFRLIDLGQSEAEMTIPGLSSEVIAKVVDKVRQMQFKHQVPYMMPTKENT